MPDKNEKPKTAKILEEHEMNRRILERAAKLIPPLSANLHKGQLGRMAVIGGSEDYTGAPFFSAMSSARLGADMCHVICTPSAAAVIKTYSPTLMVHPLMFQADSTSAESTSRKPAKEIAQPIIDLFARLHVLVVGPGLGRDKLMQEVAAEVLIAAKEKELPVVIDADGLFLVQHRLEIAKGWEGLVLTPNVAEFSRLCEAANVKDGKGPNACGALADALGGVTIVQKGQTDIIAHGSATTMVVKHQGGLKRSSGQGDFLSGTLATFLAWRGAYHNKSIEGWPAEDEEIDEKESLSLAVYAASTITREASRRAFEKHGRGIIASDMIDEVSASFQAVFGEWISNERDISRL